MLSKLVTSYESNSKIIDHFYENQSNFIKDLKSPITIDSAQTKVVKIKNK
jgi:hypothetical protein